MLSGISPTGFQNPAPRIEPAQAVESEPRKVLIVDDDELQVAALEHRLRRLGFDVLTAGLGKRALRLAVEESPNAILLDLRLPDMDGFDVCAQLADDPLTWAIPVIIVSALERPDIVRRCRAVGCGYYLRKPYDPNVLLTLIERALHDT